MLGKPNDRTLKTKAAETKGLLMCVAALLKERDCRIRRADVWALAADTFIAIGALMDDAAFKLKDSECQELARLWLFLKRQLRRLGLPFMPKNHLMNHVLGRSSRCDLFSNLKSN